MKVGIAGAGGFARKTALPGFKMSPEAEVVAVYDANAGNAQRAAIEFDIPRVCSSLDALLSEKLDLVYVAAPPGAHFELAAAVIAAGVNLLVEKPTARGSADVRDLLERAERAHLVHAVDHEMRFGAVYRHMRDLVQSGYLGEIRRVNFSYFCDYAVNPAYPPYYYSFATLRSQSGGVLRGLGSHYLDLTHYMFGDFEILAGYAPTIIKQRPEPPTDSRPYEPIDPGKAGPLREVDADDEVSLLGRMPNGAPVSYNLGRCSYHSTGARWDLIGSDGVLRYYATRSEWGGALLGASKGEGLTEIVLPPEFDPAISMEDPRHMSQCFAMEVTDIFAAIRGDRAYRRFCTLRDELAVWRDIEASEALDFESRRDASGAA